jgi:hypothetical protein
LYVASNVADQSDVQNRDIRIKKVLSRWITGKAAAIELGQRYLERFALAPVEADFMLDAKDSNLKLCDFVTVESPQKQDFTGSPLAVLLQIVKRIEKQTGTTWAFTARQFAFSTQTFSNRTVDIDGSDTSLLFDLNLKAAHDKIYDPASLVSGSIVEIIIRSGVLISASSTSNYALTNPNTWPSGVFVRLIIDSGAIVCGLGGSGGNGGNGAYSINAANGQNGGNGGNALLAQYPISINNQSVIAGGGGGGAGGGGGGSATDGTFIAGGGGGGAGGGGRGVATGGAKGLLGTTTTGGGSYTKVSSTNGLDGGNGTISDYGEKGLRGSGGAISAVDFYSAIGGNGGNGGDGGDFGQNGNNGISGNAGVLGDIGRTLYAAGSAGTGGTAGDAIHGNSLITWENTGTIYGAIT